MIYQPIEIPVQVSNEELAAKEAPLLAAFKQWRSMSQAFEEYPHLDDEHLNEDGAKVHAALVALWKTPAHTAQGVMAKLSSVECGHDLEMEAQPGMAFFDILKWDVERMMKREIFGEAHTASGPGNTEKFPASD